MPTPSDISPEGIQFVPLGGMNESVLPELLPSDDFPFLQGLTQNRQGELIRIPGKSRITRLGASPILSFVQFGDNIIAESATQLVRFSNSEIFGGIESAPNPSPDHYRATLTEEEENLMSQVLLKYRVAGNTDSASVSSSTWTRIPFTNEDRDSGGNCVLDGSGNFTLSASSYPIQVRIKARVGITPNAGSGHTIAQMILETNTGSPGSGTFVVAGMNATCARGTATNSTFSKSGICELIGSFSLAASTQYRLVIWANGNIKLGQRINTGTTQEVYGDCELLFEPNIVPVADGTVTPVTTITTTSGIVTAVA